MKSAANGKPTGAPPQVSRSETEWARLGERLRAACPRDVRRIVADLKRYAGASEAQRRIRQRQLEAAERRVKVGR